MAAEQLDDSCFSVNITNNLVKNEETKRQFCDILRADLQKANLDILSYKEIIKLLLEEQSSSQQQQRSEEPWREVTSLHPTTRETTMRTTSRVGITWSNLIQVTATTNKFEILTNLCDQNLSKF